MENILSDVKIAFDLFKESINLFNSAKELLPDSSEKTAAENVMTEAINSAKVAEAKLAQSLGFHLCPKHWPPVVLTATRVTKNHDTYECTTCGTTFINQSKRVGGFRLDEIPRSEESHPQEDGG